MALFLFLTFVIGNSVAIAAEEDEQAAELKRQQQIAEKFLSVLVKNPRRGTALDRVYGYYVESGTLDQFVADLKKKTESSPDDATSWMMLGLIEAQRGHDLEAIEAFQQTEKKNPKNAMACYYMGLSQNLLGQPEEAVASMERAIERRPPPADLLEIYQQLGRIHQRAQRNEEALKIWSRLEADFPNDPRVQEQIAVSLLEEGRFDQALPRYEALAKQVKDDYRRTVYAIQSAELKIKLGQREAGIKGLETKLNELNPDSWLHRDIRRRIEDVFLRSGDQDGLVGYYEKWISGHADDVDAMARLARFLARSARVPEATTWLEKALKLAPSRKELRIAFIEQLVDDQRYAEAAQQYESLDKADPNNPDYLREWGRVILRDKQRPKDERVAAAEAIWSRLAASKPKDPLIATQVADLFRHQEMSEPALKLYRQAVELSPDEPQYREYLGEYLHQLKKPDEALAMWREIVAGKRHNVTNVTRLAEILMNHGFSTEAVKSIAEACEMDPKDFSLQLKSADYHNRAQQYPAALTFIEGAQKLAANDDEREMVLAERIKVLQASNTLDDQIDALAAIPKHSAQEWYVLARYYDADRRSTEAAEAIQKSVELEPKSIPALTAAARILEQSGGLALAADRFRQLADVDRRFRSEHLSNVARLEAQLGRTAEALAAGKQLIAATPGNTSNYVTYADLCFRLGQSEEGLDTLRKAVRIDPNEIALLTNLGSKLADQLRTNEAIQTYWQAFEKNESNDDRLGIVAKLTDLHLQLNQLDKLIERLERDRREESKRRSFTICLAQVHQTAGDFGSARAELESLLSRETRDSELLNQLSKLCQAEQDLESAIQFQQQLVRVAPGQETEMRLAQLYQSAGYREEASALFLQNAIREEAPVRRLKGIDSLLRNGDYDLASSLIDNLLREQPQSWELLYRDGLAWASRDKIDDAKGRFQRILDMDLPLETAGIELLDKQKQEEMKAKTNAALGRSFTRQTRATPFSPIDRLYDIQRATRIVTDYYGGNQNQTLFVPNTYGEARLACIGWMYRFENQMGRGDEYTAALKTASEQSKSSRAIMDWIYLASLRQDGKSQFEASRKLALSGSQDEQLFFLASLEVRTRSPDQINYYNNSARKADTTPPLSDEDLDLVLKCVKANSAPIDAPNSPQAYRRMNFLTTLAVELKRAHRDSSTLIEEYTRPNDPMSLSAACSLAANEQLVDKAVELYGQWSQKALVEISKHSRSMNPYGNPHSAMIRLMGHRALEKANGDVLRIMDCLLDHSQANSTIIRSRPTRQNTNRNQRQPSGISIWYGEQQNYVQIDQPLPNEFLDSTSLGTLRQAFENFKKNDVLSDLIPHLKKRAENASGVDRVAALQAFGAVLWWNDEKEEAVKQFVAAAELVPQDQALKLELASVQSSMGDYDAALEVLDRIVPRDQNLLQTREMLALQLAERVGDAERARAAAERLFGVRLDSQTQISLAGHMRRLGLNALAESITSRAQRSSGNQLNSQLTLMTLYQGQGKAQEAIQLAHQVLRRTTPSQGLSARRVRSSDQSDQARQQALQFLNQMGQLPEMIARLEKSQASGHLSSRTSAQLAELYTTAGKRDKSLELAAVAVQQQPNDAVAHFQYGQQLEQAGKSAEACDQFLIVLKSKPELMADEIWRFSQLFQQAQKMTALAEAMDTMDLKRTFRHPSYVMNVVQPLIQKQETRDVGVRLLKHAAKEFSNNRGQLFQNIYQDEIWNLPEVFELALQSLVPSKTETITRPWLGLDQLNSASQGGHVNSIVSKVIESAKRLNKLDELRKAINDRNGGLDDWPAGQIYLALIDAKEGKKAEAEQAFKNVLANDQMIKALPAVGKWVIGQEIESIPELQPRAIDLLKDAAESDEIGFDFEYSPANRLVRLYISTNRRDDAIRLMRDALKQKHDRNSGNGDYEIYRRIQTQTSLAEQLLKVESPIDAARAFRELLANTSQFEIASRWSGQSASQLKRRVEQGMAQSISSLQSDRSGIEITSLLSSQGSQASGSQAIDFMVLPPDVSDLSKSNMSSVVIDLLKKLNEKTEIRQNLVKQVDQLAEKQPEDVSVAITRCLFATFQGPNEGRLAVDGLIQFVDKHPLDEIDAGKRANQRQRTQAQDQIPLWFVARTCLADSTLAEAGEKLGVRALAAARRQLDFNFTASILNEWAAIDWKAGRRESAEQRWSELLDAVTVRPKSERKKTSESAPVPRAKPAAPNRVGGANDKATSQMGLPPRFQFLQWAMIGAPPSTEAASKGQDAVIPPLTIPQFQVAMSVAKTAAEHGLQALSFRAVDEALKAGPPIQVTPDGVNAQLGNQRQVVRANQNRSGQLTDVAAVTPESFSLVARSLRSLAGTWEVQQFPAASVYDVLLPIVLPRKPSTDVKIYLEDDGMNSGYPTSLGSTLVSWAIRAQKIDELKKEIAERSSTPGSMLNALSLQTLIALQQQDDATATELFKKLSENLKSDRLPENVSLACHVAIKGFERESLRPIVAPIITDILQIRLTQGAVVEGAFLRKLFRYLGRHGDPEIVKKRIDEFLVSRQAQYSRNGEYGLYQQQQDLATTASIAATGSLTELGLDLLGRAVDIPAPNYGSYGGDRPLWAVLTEMMDQEPAHVYRVLSEWTLPKPNRKLVRFDLVFNRPFDVPAMFLPQEQRNKKNHDDALSLSTFEVLADAAERCGKMDELLEQTKAIVADDVRCSKSLYAYLLIKKGDVASATPLLKELIASFSTRHKSNQGNSRDVRLDYLVAAAAIKRPELLSIGREYVRHINENVRSMNFFDVPLARVAFLELGLPAYRFGQSPSFAYWNPIPVAVGQYQEVTVPVTWIPSGDGVLQVGGSGEEVLASRFPIEGEFEFTIETVNQPFSEGAAGYAGLLVIPDVTAQTQIRAVDSHESINRPDVFDRRGDMNHITVRHQYGQLQFLVNGQLQYEEPAGRQSPWLTLRSSRTLRSYFRNPKLSGHPTIPKEVSLVDGNRLDGWVVNHFGENQPRRRLLAEPLTEDEISGGYSRRSNEPAIYDWEARDGELFGTRRSDKGLNAQSRLYYFRPMSDGDTVRYEFFYEPSKTGIHPTFGNVAYVLGNEDIKLHWMTRREWDFEIFGVEPTNVSDDPAATKSTGPLPFKVGEWNSMEVTYKGQKINLVLNGKPIYERLIPANEPTTFGFFRYKDLTESHVRNIKLSGDWPTEVPADMFQHAFTLKEPVTPELAQENDILKGESLNRLEAFSVWKECLKKSDADRLRHLLDWVVPNDHHVGFRLWSFEVPDAMGDVGDVTRLADSARIAGPCLELISTARRLNRLDELQKAVEHVSEKTPAIRRGKLALQAMVAAASKQNDVVEQCVKQLLPLIDALEYVNPESDRYPEYSLVVSMLDRPELGSPARELIQKLIDKYSALGGDGWNAKLRPLESTVHVRFPASGSTETVSNPLELKQWHAASHRTIEHRGKGLMPAAFRARRGQVDQDAGDALSVLFYQSPIQGDFELSAEVSVSKAHEGAIGYGMSSVSPNVDRKGINSIAPFSGVQKLNAEFPAGTDENYAKVRLVSKDRKLTWSVNGAEVRSNSLPAVPDPWITLSGLYPYSQATIRNVQITGTPIIPDSIELSSMTDLVNWRADEYGDQIGSENDKNMHFFLRGDELTGRLRKDRTGKNLPSLIVNQRPMTFDGELTYEFFYVPNEFEVHPAFGRTCWLIGPSGFHRKRLNNAQWEDLNELSADAPQATLVSGAAPQLKEHDWNRVKLTWRGPSVAISVNDQPPIVDQFDPRDARQFGLFRYADRNQVRVRKMKLTGEWPKTIPPVSEQELSLPAEAAVSQK